MQTKLLIDSIIRQTTVLIAQLSATAGMRAPLARLADAVFLSLSKELEDQGVSRKVVADMFGLALRTYQRRIQRLEQSATDADTTIWQAVLDYLQEEGQVSRKRVFDRFRNDDPEAIGAVLNDLVQTGLISKTGGAHSSVYAMTPEETRRTLARQGKEETATAMVWLDVCRHPGSLANEVAARINLEEDLVEQALARLKEEGQLTSDADGPLQAKPMVIDVGSEAGWEAAVFDHFQAVAAALTAKLRRGKTRSEAADTTGGTTLCFEIKDGHPLESEVLDLLSRMRRETDELWERVRAVNRQAPLSEDETKRVIFYFGQFVQDEEES